MKTSQPQIALHYQPRVVLSGVTGKRSKGEAEEVREYFLTYAAPEELRRAHKELKALAAERLDSLCDGDERGGEATRDIRAGER